ncbi:hyccin isoform X2 [Tribolium castaneum]|uniref:Hyccin-like Protein n=2 Tax=Tribolium castaneum TaxID=7070 RepID=D6WLF5_TRICA|nr:PREDICTED: hyccin isoform X2 [Tribolium castaneum]EFA04775.2 Hyccin-like Protein [Tribolium castaneum]|eukprot:XP_008193528.1 PREDICTED: hyccin isoform X2 [Tribolium castaneum]
MADILVLDWMEEFESLTESEIHTYSSEQEHNHEVMVALYDILTEPYRFKGQNLIDGICQQLLDFYRSGEEQLKKFTLQYIPTLVFLHLTEKTYTSVQTLLVSLYNLEVIDSKGQPRTLSFRVPSIAQSSIYHDSNNLEPAFIAENSLRRWEECNSKLVSWGPLPQVECLNAQNRQRVITALVFLYNQQLASVISQGIEHTCRGISRLVSQGFSSNDSARSSINSDCSYSQGIAPRIPVSSPLLLELLHIVYHGAEKGVNGAVQALHDITQRAKYEAFADVLLSANAIKNLIQRSSSVSVTPRPSQSHSISKSMITNASFRTKKLPDDIPIQDEHQTEVPLDSITEEQEEADKSKPRGSVSALKHLPKLPGLGKKHKVKNPPSGGDQVEMQNAGGESTAESPSTDFNHAVHVSAV